MKIIKMGVVPMYRATCKDCGSELEASKSMLLDTISSTREAVYFGLIGNCPVCNTRISSWEKVEDIKNPLDSAE